MTDLVLSENEQVTVRAVIASEPVPGVDLPGEGVLQHVARLIPCDAMGTALLDGTGWAVGEASVGLDWMSDDDLSSSDAPATLGIQHRHRPSRYGGPGTRGAAVLSLGVRQGTHVVTLWLVRRTRDFSRRDRAVLELVAPAIERVLRERPTWSLPPSLTVQERRVLHHVAAGLSNGEIAERLFVAPCTVRKHLENAYRKLGVSNRIAAVHALEAGQPTEADCADLVPAFS